MDTAAARSRLLTMVAASSDPVLSSTEVDDLMQLARRPDARRNVPLLSWAPSTAYTVYSGTDYPLMPDYTAYTGYSVNTRRVPTTANGHVYIVTVAGVSGSTEPAWPTTGGATVVDGTVTWQEAGLYLWTPTYDLRAAAAEGWRWKAAKAAARFAYSADGSSVSRNQVYDHCMQMAATYGQQGLASVRMLSRAVR